MGTERIQKILAAAGVGSRRKCEEMIAAGRVTVNGRVAKIGERADGEKDKLEIDGVLVPTAEGKVYLALYKPPGVLSTTRDERGRKTVMDLIPRRERIYPVGRLDLESEGLILLTNDGEMALELSHPRFGHEKEYRVLIAGKVKQETLEQWRAGVRLEDGYTTKRAQVRVEGKRDGDTWVRVILKEGHKRQIRETAKRLGLQVKRLIRIRMGTLEIGTLSPGEWRKLTRSELKKLKQRPPKRRV